MKKFLGGVMLGALLVVPVGAFAAQYTQLPWTANIYKISSPEGAIDTVSVFDDAGNKCYVINSGVNPNAGRTISCVKESR